MTALRGEDAIGRPKHSMTQHSPAVKTHRAKRVLGSGRGFEARDAPLRKPSEPLVASSLAE